jgi:phage recombination protein Bet
VAEEKTSLLATLGNKYNLDPQQFLATVQKTVMPGQATKEQTAAFLAVANQYDLNPFTKEIYAFPTRGGGIQPMVPIDGWLKLINNHTAFDGMDIEFGFKPDGSIDFCTCKIYRKDREHPQVHTEYYDECVMNTEPWRKKPRRMLQHKAVIQCARYAFSFSGIIDPDEGEMYNQMHDAEVAREPEVDPHGGVASLKARLEEEVVDAEFSEAEEAQEVDQAPPVPDYFAFSRSELFATIKDLQERLGWTREQILDGVNRYVRQQDPVTGANQLTNDELVRVCCLLEEFLVALDK